MEFCQTRNRSKHTFN